LIDGSRNVAALKKAAISGICALPRQGHRMESDLAGRSVLIVEDEPLIALHIRTEFEKAGANAITVHSLRDAVGHVERDGLSGAVLDYGRGSQDGDALCRHLKQRDIPFILHSGYEHIRMPVVAESSFRNRPSPRF
jgi:CheY-like chemotaxis protein